jgi:hypothetical protein
MGKIFGDSYTDCTRPSSGITKEGSGKQKALYDRFRRKAPDFKPGDLVLKKNSSDQVSFAAARWTGPLEDPKTN